MAAASKTCSELNILAKGERLGKVLLFVPLWQLVSAHCSQQPVPTHPVQSLAAAKFLGQWRPAWKPKARLPL